MSYTLRGRIESRLAATLPALAVALAVHRWWAIELVALMLALGLALDVLVYHRALPYQPGWVGLPLGALELGLVYAAMRAIPVHAPLRPALALYAFAWIAAQICGHAVFPRFQLSYAEDGGELRRAGPLVAISVAAVLAGTAGVAYATRAPTVHLRGVHRGPLVVSHAETLTGGVVHGAIVVRASHVTVRNVTVVAGEYGIVVEDARDVKLENVRVVGASLDGIHVRHSTVEIRDCMVTSPRGPWTQGIDISFGGDLGMSMVEGCTVVGAREGIVTHFSQVVVRENRIVDARLRGITMGEMSMGMVEHNEVAGSLGVGILCLDYSQCEIERNVVTSTRPDTASGDLTRRGVAIEAHYFAHAQLRSNTVVRSPGGVAAFDGATIAHR